MPIDMMRVNAHVAQFQGCASDIRAAINQLRSYQNALNANWSGRELGYINAEIEYLCDHLQRASSQMSQLAGDVRMAGTQAYQAEQVALKPPAGGK